MVSYYYCYIFGWLFPHHFFFFPVMLAQLSIVMFVSYLHISVWTTNYWTTRALFHIFFQYSTEPTTGLAEKNGGLQSIGSQRVKHDWSNLACNMHGPRYHLAFPNFSPFLGHSPSFVYYRIFFFFFCINFIIKYCTQVLFLSWLSSFGVPT